MDKVRGVSTVTQNIDRQMDEMYKHGLSDNEIFIDKQSGKDFNREKYQELRNILKEKRSINNKIN